ncbi:CYTH and CHAD domain-containing protein [Arthrobacter nitrophenolicus]|uniref:CYTH and CHAD domain-containing protein n=1 Tax=Arthrobacter nitrophenolicus TaxID=683150 RepID=A0A4R5YD98_9MICC|nr:CYTH and CHAD domain-containing protein [Arthrobacter nitrophenolicus]TDL41235.1 CYTH and CHAD domain-containing protein [Arthrobacter nitrophenolicus]
MEASQGLEVEKKYDVGSDATVPPLNGLPGVARVDEPHTAKLEAVYFDTADHALAARRITLRRRTGGGDAGWHLKLPPEEAAGTGDAEPQQRREVHAPLGQAGVVPEALLARVQAYLRGAEVVPVAKLRTERTTHALYGEDGVHLADLADDLVTAERLPGPDGGGGGNKQQWREWELELVNGDASLFAPADQLLMGAGARPAGHASKLAKALGAQAGSQDADAAPDEAIPALPAGKKSPAAAVVTVYAAAQIKELLDQDAAIRLEEPEAVHDMRSATRRLRSVLAAYRKLYRAVPVRRLRDELKWLGQLLGEPRDAEVLLARLRGHLDDLGQGPGPDAARDRLERQAGATYDAGYRRLQEAMRTERYFRLLDSLEEFRDNPPVRTETVPPGRRVAAKAVDKAAKRLRRSHRAAFHARRGTDHENALHRVRKDAKKLRHVAESAGLIKGKRANKVAKAAHRQQKILGDYHDAVMARDLLSGMGSDRDRAAVSGAYAALLQRQEELMSAAEAKYRKASKKSRDLLRRGVL